MTKRKKKQQQLPLAAIIGGGVLLLVVAAVIWMQNQAGTAVQPETESIYPDIQRVSLVDAKSAFDAGEAVFVDVRSVEAYEANRVAGAVNIPITELEQRLGELDKAKWIITYCT